MVIAFRSEPHILKASSGSPPDNIALRPQPRAYFETCFYATDMSVVLVTGSYDHEIRFWEAWSGICSRTIARSGESGVRRATASKTLRDVSDLHPTASEPSSYFSGVNTFPFCLSLLDTNIQVLVSDCWRQLSTRK